MSKKDIRNLAIVLVLAGTGVILGEVLHWHRTGYSLFGFMMALALFSTIGKIQAGKAAEIIDKKIVDHHTEFLKH